MMDLDTFVDGIYQDPRARFAFDHMDVRELLGLIFEGQSSSDILSSHLDAIAADAETNGFKEDEILKHSNEVAASVNYIIASFWRLYGDQIPLTRNGPNHCGGFNRSGKVVVIEKRN